MRRLVRWFTHLLAAVCLLLGLACLIAWPVSYWRTSGFIWDQIRDVSKKANEVKEGSGTVNFSSCFPRFYRGRFWLSLGWGTASEQVHTLLDEDQKKDSNDATKTNQHGWEFIWEASGTGTGSMPWFQIDMDNQAVAGPNATTQMSNTEIEIIVPSALIGAILAVPSVFWFLRLWWIRRRPVNRLDSGLCLHCGYHLTGVAGDRCPECGAVRPTVSLLSQEQ